MPLTPDRLNLLVQAALLISFAGLCFCLFVVSKSRDNRQQTFEALGLLGISGLAVYAGLLLNTFSPDEAAPWKFSLLAALNLYILFNIATFPQRSE